MHATRAPLSPGWRRHLGRIALLATVVGALAGTSASAALAANGNNGTVKIHEGTSHADPPRTDRNNQPHVCTFHIHGFGFDADDTGTWRIYDWPPTGDRSLVLNGSWSGETWVSTLIELPDGHYRLVTNIDGDANDGRDDDVTADKHKVFWVDCEEAPIPDTVTPPPAAPTPPRDETTPPPNGATTPPADATPIPGGEEQPVSPSPTGEEAPAGGVGGVVGEGPTLPPTDTLTNRASGGPDAMGMVLLALAAIGSIALASAVRVARRR